MWKGTLVVLVVFIAYNLMGCKAHEEEGPQYEYDYLLNEETDIISPPSGTADAWIYVIGGNVTGSYYVAPWGIDSNSGTFDDPWKTLSYGVSQLSPGDTLVVLPDSGRTRPIIAGGNNLRAGIDLSGRSYVWVENLELTHNANLRGEGAYFRDCVIILGQPAHHIVLKNLYIHHIDEYGMNIQDVDSLLISGCRLEYCGFGGLGGPLGEHGGWRHVTVSQCTLAYGGHYYQGGDGSTRPYDRPDGFGIEVSSGPILIERTISAHNYGDGLDSKAENTTITQCVVANNSCDGVKLWGDHSRVVNTLIYGRGDGNSTPTSWAAIVIDEVDKPDAEFEIINCTLDDTVGENYFIYVQYEEGYPGIRLTMINNIFSSRGPNSPIFIRGTCSVTAENNLFYFPNSPRVLEYGDSTYYNTTITDFGISSLYGDPKFVKTAWGTVGDYHLKNGSPAIDAGTSHNAPPVDLDGNARPLGGGFDIGCYEM